MYRVVGVQVISLFYPSRLTGVQIKYISNFLGNVADFTLSESKVSQTQQTSTARVQNAAASRIHLVMQRGFQNVAKAAAEPSLSLVRFTTAWVTFTSAARSTRVRYAVHTPD